MKDRVVYVVLPLLLVGCAGKGGLQPHELRAYNDDRLCFSTRWVQAAPNKDLWPALREEILRRGLMTEAEIDQNYRTRIPSIGRNRCYLIASRGFPDDTNTTYTKGSVHKQLIYRILNHSDYYYTDNDIITGIQY